MCPGSVYLIWGIFTCQIPRLTLEISMPPNVYIVASRMRLAEVWMYQNETFLRKFLGLEDRPILISSDGWKDADRLRGLPKDALIILVDLHFRHLRQLKQMHPHYIFISCDLD